MRTRAVPSIFYSGNKSPVGCFIKAKKELEKERYKLLWVVIYVDEYSGIELPHHTIQTFDDDPMQIHFHELIIKDQLPLLLEHMVIAPSFELVHGGSFCMQVHEIIKGIQKLRTHQVQS